MKAKSPTGGKIILTQTAHGAFTGGRSIDIRRLDDYDYATIDGTIKDYRNYRYKGKTINDYKLQNGKEWFRYIHSSPILKVGTKVKAGQRIGKKDGYIPTHLHLDYWDGTKFVNPLEVIDRRTKLELAPGMPWKSTSQKYTKWSTYKDRQLINGPITTPTDSYSKNLYKKLKTIRPDVVKVYKESNVMDWWVTYGSREFPLMYEKLNKQFNSTKEEVSFLNREIKKLKNKNKELGDKIINKNTKIGTLEKNYTNSICYKFNQWLQKIIATTRNR